MRLLSFLVSGLVLCGRVAAQEFPSPEWRFDSVAEGWNKSRLDTLRKFVVDKTPVTAMMVVHKGKVVFQFGDVKENSYVASVRKSILSILYGPYVEDGTIKLSSKLGELGMDDIGGLLPIEKQATIKDLISARSGVYHEASYPGDYLSQAPKRGSVKPGSYWLYSNWDFNAAGYVFEKLSGKNIYDETARLLATPLQMQDWDRSLQHKEGDSAKSLYPAYPIFLSARDMARIGLMMLQKGNWNGITVMDKRWIEQMTSAHTSFEEVNRNIKAYRGAPGFAMGYGYMWWLWQNVSDKRLRDAYSALGNMGQTITICPAIDVVIVFKTKEDYERSTPFDRRFKLITLAAEAFEGRSASE